MTFEYIARFTLTFFLIGVAIFSEYEQIRYFTATLASMVLFTIWCLVIIEKSGQTEQALKFKEMYLDSAP